MRYRDAKKLHSGDEVARKSDGAILSVVETRIYPKVVMVTCQDGEEYQHTDVK